MDILITNDDGINAKGIKVLAETMRQFGRVTVIAPKTHQSGMSMALSMGLKPIAYKKVSEQDGISWSYLDATPASCVKFGIGRIFTDKLPDVVVSGINHGSNAASASCYSGTLGAAEEAALNGIPAIGVSLDCFSQNADFSAVKELFPDIFRKLMSNLPEKYGIFYNINFPDIPKDKIKGIKVGYQGKGKWIREFREWDKSFFEEKNLSPEMFGNSSRIQAEEGEEIYVMVGEFVDDKRNTSEADHRIMGDGYISIVAHNLDTTDYDECDKLRKSGFNITL